jgi:hypothetical protein
MDVLLLARLAHLSRALAQLERLAALPRSRRASDVLYQLAAERALHV